MARSSPASRRRDPSATAKASPFRPVQLAQLVGTVPAGMRWPHEMKYDGHRTLAIGGGEAHAYMRSGLDWSDRFAAILEAARKLDVRSALIDGEAVVLDAAGRRAGSKMLPGRGRADQELPDP